MPVPQYYYHSELLNSKINKLETLYNELYFVTIQPLTTIWEKDKDKGIPYVNALFNNNFRGIIQFENNYVVTNNSFHLRSTERLPTLHMHLIVDKQYLDQIHDVYHYKHNREFKTKRNIHITATPLRYKEGLIKYLSKQFEQNLLPFIHKIFAQETDIYSNNTVTMIPQNNTVTIIPQSDTVTIIPPYNTISPVTLFQLLISGITYSEATTISHRQLKDAMIKGAIKSLKRAIRDKKHVSIICKKPYIIPYLVGVKPKPPPIQLNVKS